MSRKAHLLLYLIYMQACYILLNIYLFLCIVNPKWYQTDTSSYIA